MPSGIRSRLVLVGIVSAAALAIVVIAVLMLGGSGAKPSTLAADAATAAPRDGFAGGVVSPQPLAPALALRDATGAQVDLAADRGDAVFVTFLYTNCPDVCPLTTAHLRNALDRMPPSVRAKVRIIAVSVDPAGDTAAAVRRFLALHHMTGRMSYLIGSVAELRPIWKAWGVAAVTDTSSNFVSHSALIYGIAADGRLTTIYPWSVASADLVHDAPRLIARRAS
jgi:protein SCO1/2